MGIAIHLQKRGFAVSVPISKKRINWDALTDALFALPTVTEIEGPFANGALGVTYEDDERADAFLSLELEQVCRRFI